MTPLIEIKNIRKTFGAAAAVENVSLTVYDKEFLALLGPSGCGKTTLLRMLGGFETPTSGEIFIGGKNMRGLPPNRRPVNMVFQSYALFPHMTARENIAYGLRVVKTPPKETEERVREALALVRMEKFAEKPPEQLSGGQRQRIALARALVKKPKALLLDEPLSALDAKLREAMRAELVKLQKSAGVTFVIVTHDQDEALSVAGRIAVMREGAIRQIDEPRALYESPANKFVADFIGRMNILPAKRAPSSQPSQPSQTETITITEMREGDALFNIDGLGLCPVRGDAAEDAAVAAIRPEKLTLRAANENPAPGECCARAKVTDISYRGGETLVTVQTENGATLTAASANKSRNIPPWSPGESLTISWSPEDIIALAD